MANMDVLVSQRFQSLEQKSRTSVAEYVWIDASGHTRSKARTLERAKTMSVDALPTWTFDGSSTWQAPGDDSEVLLQPVAMYPDPFRPGGNNNILVLCECLTPADRSPIASNTRHAAAAIFDREASSSKSQPWFGLEQEYTLFNLDKVTPLGWPEGGFPAPQGPYYCGASSTHGRAVPEAHFQACLYAGLDIFGINAEVCPGQWEVLRPTSSRPYFQIHSHQPNSAK